MWRLELKGELSRRFITAIIRGVRRRFADTAFFSRDARVRARPFVASPQESQSAPFVLLPRFPPRRPVDCIAASASVASDIPRFFSFASVCAAAEMPFSRARGATTPRRFFVRRRRTPETFPPPRKTERRRRRKACRCRTRRSPKPRCSPPGGAEGKEAGARKAPTGSLDDIFLRFILFSRRATFDRLTARFCRVGSLSVGVRYRPSRTKT